METNLVELLGGKASGEGADGYYTREELCALVNRSRRWVSEKLRVLLAAGRLDVRQKETMDLDGKIVLAPAYKLKTEPSPPQARKR